MYKRGHKQGWLCVPWLTLFLAVFLIFEIIALNKIDTAKPVGVWKDVDSDYYVVFDNVTSTYRETTYNMSRPYDVYGDSVILTGVDGQQAACQLGRNFGSKVLLMLNGEEHLMVPVDEAPKLNPWNVEPKAVDCIAVYSSKLSMSAPQLLRIYKDHSYVFKNIDLDIDLQGKYVVGSDGTLLLFSDEDTVAEALKPWELGYAMGVLETNITATTLKANVIDNRGLSLHGYVRIPEAGVTYDFQDDNIVTRTLSSGESVQMLYFVDNTGLVTMADMVGGNVKDYMWYDQVSSTMYRYVFERDDWFDFVGKVGIMT